MEAIYKKNLAVLKKRHPQAYEAVMKIEDAQFSGELIFSSEGVANLKVQKDGNSYFIHTQADLSGNPDCLSSLPADKYYVVVIMGMGLGYTIQTILTHKDLVQRLVVFESEAWIFKLAMEARDMTGVLSDPRLLIGVGREPDIPRILAQAQRALQVEDIHLMKQQVLNELWPEAYERIHKQAFAEISRYNIEGGTLSKHGMDIMSNRLSMLTSVHHNQMLESLEGKFADVPAFVVAAGPSLDKNMAVLKKAKGKGVIICVDTALPNLLRNGIKPDFVTCLDFLEFTYEKISGQADYFSGISLICMGSATWKVSKLIPADQVYWCFPASPIDRWLCNAMGGSLVTPGAGTVAHVNLIAARILGCSEIIFVGQDLAYSENHFYTDNVVLSEHDDIRKRIESKADDIMWVEGNAGKNVPTSRQFYSHISTFEAMIEGMISQPCINTSIGGAKIRGTQVMSLKKAVESYCNQTIDVAGRLGDIVKTTKGPNLDRLTTALGELSKTIIKLRKKVEKADKLGQDALGKLQKNSRQRVSSLAQLPQGIQKSISKIDILQNNLDSEQDFWPLLDDITQDDLKYTERMKLEIEMVAGKPGKYRDWLVKSLKRLAYVNEKRLGFLKFLDGYVQGAIDHYAREQHLLSQLSTHGQDEIKVLTNLVALYFESRDLVLAEPYIEKLNRAGFESAKLWLYQGVIAANRLNFILADECFSKAQKMDGDISKEIYEFKFNQGNNYLVYASWYKKKGRSTFIAMLIKGVWYMPDNGGIKLEVAQLIDEDIQQFKAELEKGLDPESENRSWLWGWKDYIEQGCGVGKIAGPQRISDIYRFCGMYKNLENDHGAAIGLFESAHAQNPTNPEILIQMTDVLFSLKQFDQGVAALNKAVALDRNYGRYWENMGDNLMGSQDYTSAAMAYENCYKALPEYSIAGCKLAECLKTLGQNDRAEKILEQIKIGSA